jgi:hypothetical protein
LVSSAELWRKESCRLIVKAVHIDWGIRENDKRKIEKRGENRVKEMKRPYL